MQNVDIYDWLRYEYVIPDHKLIIIILKLANICRHCIYSKKVWPAYSKLVMLGAIFAKVLAITLTATVTEQKNTLTSRGMVDLEIIAVNPNRQDIFYTCSTRPHTGDDKIEGLLLLYTAKLQNFRGSRAATPKPHRGVCVGLSMTFTNHFRHLRFSNLLRTTNSFYTRLYNRQFL